MSFFLLKHFFSRISDLSFLSLIESADFFHRRVFVKKNYWNLIIGGVLHHQALSNNQRIKLVYRIKEAVFWRLGTVSRRSFHRYFVFGTSASFSQFVCEYQVAMKVARALERKRNKQSENALPDNATAVDTSSEVSEEIVENVESKVGYETVDGHIHDAAQLREFFDNHQQDLVRHNQRSIDTDHIAQTMVEMHIEDRIDEVDDVHIEDAQPSDVNRAEEQIFHASEAAFSSPCEHDVEVSQADLNTLAESSTASGSGHLRLPDVKAKYVDGRILSTKDHYRRILDSPHAQSEAAEEDVQQLRSNLAAQIRDVKRIHPVENWSKIDGVWYKNGKRKSHGPYKPTRRGRSFGNRR